MCQLSISTKLKYYILQSTLGFETLDKAAALGLATATPLTDPRQYINSNLGFSNLKIWLLYSKIAAVVVAKPSGNKNKHTKTLALSTTWSLYPEPVAAALALATSTPLTEGGFKTQCWLYFNACGTAIGVSPRDLVTILKCTYLMHISDTWQPRTLGHDGENSGPHSREVRHCRILTASSISSLDSSFNCFRLIRRTRTKFFSGGTLLWDEHCSAGKYVRDNCKPLQVT